MKRLYIPLIIFLILAISFTVTSQQTDQPTLELEKKILDVGVSAPFNLTIDSVPDGLSGYNITITVENASVAEIVDVKYPSWAILTDNSSLPASSVWIKAVDLNDQVKPGATDVLLATLIIRVKNEGVSVLSISITGLDDDSGNPITPKIVNGSVAADRTPPTTAVTANVPTQTVAANWIMTEWTNQKVILYFHRSDAATGVDYTKLSLAEASEVDTLSVTITNNSWTWNVTLSKGAEITVPYNETFGDYFNVTIDIPEGTKVNATLQYYSVDKNGNVEDTKYVTVRIDKIPPVITFIPPTPADRSLNCTGHVTVIIQSDKALEWAEIYYSIHYINDTFDDGSAYMNKLDTEGKVWSYNLTINDDARLQYRVWVKDVIGNTNITGFRIVTVSVAPPIVNIIAPEEAVVGSTVNVTITINDTALYKYELYENGLKIGEKEYDLDEALTLQNVSIYFEVTRSAPDNITYTIKAYDYCGNENSTSKTIRFVSVGFFSPYPEPNSYVNNNMTEISVKFAQVTNIRMFVDGVEVAYTIEENRVKYVPTTPLSEGEHCVFVNGTYNGKEYNISWCFTVDTIKPVIEFNVFDTDGDGFTEIDELVKVWYNVTDVNFDKLEILVDGEQVISLTESEGWYNFTPTVIGDYKLVAYDKASNLDVKVFHVYNNYLAYAIRSEPKEKFTVNLTKLATLDLMNRSEVNVIVYGGEEISIPVSMVERTIIPGTKAKYTVYPDYRANGTITNFYQTCVVYENGSLLDVYVWTKTPAKGMIIFVKLNDSKAEDKIAEFARTFSIKGLIKIDELPEFIEGDVYFFGKEGCGRAIYDRVAEKFTGAETWGHITITEDLDDMLNESEYPHNIIDFSQGTRLTDIPGYVSGAAVTMADATGLSSLKPGTYLLLAIGKDGDVIALNAMMPIVVINGTREQIEAELALPESLPRGESFKVHFPDFVNRTSVLMLKDVVYDASVLINASEEWIRIWRVNITYDNKSLRELIYYKDGEPKHTKIWIPIGMGRGAYKKSNVLIIDTDDLEIGPYLLYIFAQEVGGRLYYAGVVEMNLTAFYAVNITSTPLEMTVEKNETAEFVLTVKNVGNVNDSYILTVEAPEELSYTLSKMEFFLPKKTSTDVTLRVWGVVPGSYIVNVTVTSMNYSDVKATVSVVVNIIKAVDIDSDVTLRPVGVGEKALFNLTITNTGLYTHDYNVTCWVDRPGAVIFLNGVQTTTCTIPNLGKGASKTVKLEVLANVNETFTVYVKANTTTKGNVEDYDNLTVIVSALAYYGVSVTPEVTYRDAERGEVVSFNLTIRNEGNVPDTYTIEVVKPPKVSHSLSAAEVTIPNGSSKVVRLDVWSNELGKYDISVITKSKSDPSISHETRLTFEVIGSVELSVDTEFKSTMITRTGERAEVEFNLTITNTGKYMHDYTLVCYNGSDVIVKLDGVPINTTTKANVPKGGSVSVILALNVTEGEYSVLVSAVTTTRGGVTEYDNVTVTAAVSMLRIYGVRLSVDKVMERIKPGQIAVYNITVMNIGNVKDNFSLTVMNPKADVASLNKTHLSIDPGKSEVVMLNVSDPEPGEYVVEVVATSEGDPSKFDSVSTTTFIESYGLILSVDTLHQTRKANESAIFTLSLLNKGNVMDNYTVTIESNCAYDLTGYDVYPIPGVGYNVTNVSAGEERILTLRLMSTVEGVYYANVTAKSQGDPSKVDFVNVTVEFKKEKVYNFELTVLPPMNFVEIYDNATFTVRIKNTGNAEDTYVLTTTEGVLENDTLTVMPGEVKTTTLTVYCTELRTFMITVTAQSTNNTSIVKSVTVYASVVPPVTLEPTPSSQTTFVCNKSKFTIRITNTGVEPHTFDISVLSNIEYYRLSTERVYLEPYEHVDVILTMHSSTVGTYYATITAYVSDRPEKSASTDVMVVYETVPIHGVTISVYPPFKQVEVGKSALYKVTVSNVGNMDEEFSISITMNETLATLANATYQGISITELIPAGKSVSLLLNVTPTEIGSYDVVINASSLNASDVVKITTTAIGERNVVKIKSIVKDSALINSKIEMSKIEFSFIDPSYIAGSEIKRCVIRNSTVLRTTLSDMELYNATVQDGMIYNGTVFLYDVPYEIAREIGIYNIVVASESKKGTVAGRAHETVAVRSDLVGAEVDILNKGGYAGGSAKFDKSTIPPKGVEEPRMDIVVVRAGELTGIAKVGDYVNITLSDVVKRNLDKATVIIRYDPTRIPAGYTEDQLSLFRYNEATGKWEELENVVVDKVTKTVRGETREFSIFAVMAKAVAAPPPPAPPPPVPAPVGGGAVIIPPPLVAPAVVTFESLPIQFIAYVPKTIEIPAEYVEKTDVLKITALTEFSGIIKVAVSKVLKLPPEIPAPKYPVYSYVEIVFYSVVGEKVTAKSGVVEFRVPKEWLREKGYDVTQVVLMKYEKEWKELKTEYVREDAKYYYFRAEVPTFSVFAIAARPPVVTPTPTPTPPPVTPTVPPVTPTPPITPTVTPTVPPPPPPPPPVWPIVAGVIIAAIVIGLVVYFVRKRRA